MKSFGHTRPIRDESGEIVGSKLSPVRVRTIEPLGSWFGSDKKKRLVLTAHTKDMVGLRPERTSRELLISATDLYTHLLRCKANLANLERARQRKAKKAERLAARRRMRAERGLLL